MTRKVDFYDMDFKPLDYCYKCRYVRNIELHSFFDLGNIKLRLRWRRGSFSKRFITCLMSKMIFDMQNQRIHSLPLSSSSSSSSSSLSSSPSSSSLTFSFSSTLSSLPSKSSINFVHSFLLSISKGLLFPCISTISPNLYCRHSHIVSWDLTLRAPCDIPRCLSCWALVGWY